MMKLFHLHHSICSQKVRFCLEEKGLAFESRIVNLSNFEHLEPWYLEINPNGVIPALVVDGEPIVESTVICEFLDELMPEPKLTPETAIGRAHMREWLRYIDEVPSMAVRVPSFQDVLLPGYRAMEKDAFDDAVRRMSNRRAFFRRMGQTGFPQEDYDDAVRLLGETVIRMDKALTRGAWLVGELFTVADICMAPVVQRMEELGFATLWAERPAVADWLDRIRARPAWDRALYRGSKFSDVFPDRVAAAT